MAEQTSSTHSETKVWPKPLSCFLKRLVEDIDSSVKSANEEQLDFLKQCKEKCCHLLKSSQSADVKADGLQQIMQETAHVVLEYTYVDETLLVDSEFPADTAQHRVSAIQEQLDQICQVAKETFQDQPMVGTLGEDIVECVHWRKGALFYMYCHTLHSHGRQVSPAHYQQCLEEGVLELEKMLDTRQPTPVSADVSADDTLQLFNLGVYSDTHLLAMMYAAELCHWHSQAVDTGQVPADSDTAASHSSPFSASRHAQRHLQAYLAAVNGPLKGQGWSSSKAEEFMHYFQQLTKD